MLRILIFVALFSVAFAGSLEFFNCTNEEEGAGKILEVYCDQFDNFSDVTLKKGKVYTFGIRFIAGMASEGLEPSIFGLIGGSRVPWKGVDQNACNDLLESKCPLVPGTEYHYRASIPILKSYPLINLNFQWGLTSVDATGKKGANHACFKMPAKITN